MACIDSVVEAYRAVDRACIDSAEEAYMAVEEAYMDSVGEAYRLVAEEAHKDYIPAVSYKHSDHIQE